MANGENSGRHATATLVALRLGAGHAFFRRHGRGGQGWPTLNARISRVKRGSLADPKPTSIVQENNTWAGFFGDLEKKNCSLNEILVNFREESSGIGRFCGLEVPTDGQLAQV